MAPVRYVGLLRAVNLGSTRKVPMAELRELMTDELGFEDVATLVQSGNVVFTAPRTSAAELGDRIGDALEARYGFEVPTMIRTGSQLAKVIEANPFLALAKDATKVHVAFADGPTKASLLADVDKEPFAPEDFQVGSAEVYLAYPNGAGRSAMKVPFEKLLGVRLTSRNWNTVTKLADLLSDP
jgi:uncharacterized protein (DUF1697 family)